MNPTNVDRQGEIVHGANESAETDIIKRLTRSEDPLLDELLPGIPDDVALAHIAALLPRKAYQEVAKVNPHWQRAFEGRMVYDARVVSKTNQTFLVVACLFIFKTTFSLFSPNEKRWYKCPPIPGCSEGGYLPNFQYVLFYTSIYLLGGTRRPTKSRIPSVEVFVLDLARHPLEWRRWANMQVPRIHPTVCVMHGKIYVLGGLACTNGCCLEVLNEVYDPEGYAWSFTAPTMPSAFISSIFSVGRQFLACIGWIDRPPTPNEHVSDEEAYVFYEAKFVVTIDDGGAKVIITSDDDAEDDMDGLHEIIEDNLDDLGKGLRRSRWSHADHLAFRIFDHEELGLIIGSPQLFLGFYDPIKDEWSAFDKESLGSPHVDQDQGRGPKYLGTLDLRPRQDSRSWLSGKPRARVWSISL